MPRPRTQFVVSQCRASGCDTSDIYSVHWRLASDVTCVIIVCLCDPGSGFSLFYKTIDLITLGFVALKRIVKIRTPIVGDNLKKMLILYKYIGEIRKDLTHS